MTRLIALELRRALARRLVRLLALLTVAGMLTAGIAVFFTHSATEQTGPDPAIAAAEQEAAACRRGEIYPPGEHVVFEGPGFYHEDTAPPVDDPRREFFCDIPLEIAHGNAARDDRYRFATAEGALLGIATPLAMMMLVLGASLIGAEWRANTVSVQLTWEPRRLRVLAAKVIAAALVGAAFYLLAQLVLLLFLSPAGVWRGTMEGVDAAWWRGVSGAIGRGSAFAGMATIIGFSIATVGRNTTAALGVMFGYFALLEGTLLGNIWPWIRRWLLVGNSIVFLTGQESPDIAGRAVVGAGLLLAAYAVGAWGLAALWFNRRDIA